MENKKYFVLSDGMVKGPFLQLEIDQKFSSNPNALIWGRGQSEWLSSTKWYQFLKNNIASISDKPQIWRVQISGTELTPMVYSDMIKYLKSKSDFTHIRIWTTGYSEWREIYQIHNIMDELGVSRRAHPRVPIMGLIQCELSNRESFTARLLSISVGGIGATEGKNIQIGDTFKIIVKSPNLTALIHTSVEVVYLDNDGYFGLRFMAIQTESESLIIEYIQKFLLSNPEIA